MNNGFENENKIIFELLNTKDFNELTSSLKKVILKINDNRIPGNFSAKKYGGKDKADLSIIIDDNEYKISVKKGSGNSIHQEPIEEFIKFLKEEVEDNTEVFNDLRFYVWGDGTLDGNAPSNKRMSASEIKKKYSSKIENIQNYFNKHVDKLTTRFITGSSVSKNSSDYLLYGDTTDCVLVSEPAIKELVNNTTKKPLSIGILTFQAWNRNLNGGNKSEAKRGQIQIKWGTLKADINKIK